MPGQRLLIFVAIQLEADAVHRAIASVQTATRVQVALVGIGASKLPTDTEAAKFGLIVSAGLAGALDPKLECGDVIVEAPTGSPAISWTFPVHTGRIHTSPDVINTPKKKADLFNQTGALAVDMESEPIRQLARRLAIPFLALRAISDKADESIDPAMLGLIDPLGRPRTGAIVGLLLRRPAILRQMLKLRSHSLLAAKNLQRCISDVMRSIEPGDR